MKKDLDAQDIFQHHIWLSSVTPQALTTDDHGVHSVFDIESSFRGYVGKFHKETVDFIRASPAVEFVEQDQMVYAYNATAELEDDAPWGLARVAHREHPDSVESHHYAYNSDAGEGVTVYIVDTVCSY